MMAIDVSAQIPAPLRERTPLTPTVIPPHTLSLILHAACLEIILFAVTQTSPVHLRSSRACNGACT